MNTQIEMFAAKVRSDPALANGFDLVGHSQGGLITRAYIERYNSPRVHNYVSLAGPQAGVYGVPDFNDWCPDVDCDWINKIMSKIAEGGWTEPLMQQHVTFAQYWRDPLNYTAYLASSSFLADINNDRAAKNATYRANMVGTTGRHVYLQALQDHIVVPKQSEWFENFAPGEDSVIPNVTATPGYLGDWVGLKTLHEQGRLTLAAVNCTHQDMPRASCKAAVYDAFIKPNVGGAM